MPLFDPLFLSHQNLQKNNDLENCTPSGFTCLAFLVHKIKFQLHITKYEIDKLATHEMKYIKSSIKVALCQRLNTRNC